MKIKISREALNDAVRRVNAAVRGSEREDPSETRVIRLAAAVRAPGGDGALDVDSEGRLLLMSARCDADVTEPGQVLLEAGTLEAVLAELPSCAPLEVTAEGGRVVIGAWGCRYSLPGLGEGDFPVVPGPGEPAAVFGAEALASAVARAAPAAAEAGELGSVLECARLSFGAKGMATMACTDRYRVAVASCRCRPGPVPAPAEVLVPARPLAAALGCGVTERVRFSLAGGHAVFSSGSWRAAVPLWPGTFPDLTEIMGPAPVTAVTAGVAELSAAVRRARAAGDAVGRVRLRAAETGTSVEAADGEPVSYAQDIPYAVVDGKPARLLLDARFLADGLDGVALARCGTARITASGPESPVVITPAAGDGTWFTYVLMPFRDRDGAAGP